MTRTRLIRFLAGITVLASLLFGCAKAAPEDGVRRQTRTTILEPAAPAEDAPGNEFAAVDGSNAETGYVQVCYSGGAELAKVQVTNPDGTVYTYTLQTGSFETLPLTGGSGCYGITVLEHAFDNIYAVTFTTEVETKTVDEFGPYLYPNQYVWYTAGSAVYALGAELSAASRDDLDYVDKVYTYVVENIVYDDAQAQTVSVGYVPDLEKTLATGKGICLDYAALMTALLRSQGIPTKLVVGYSGQVYHAWISVYLEETGWVDGTIFFDGTTWSRMDPTLAAANRGPYVKDYVNNSGNYLEKYFY